MSSTAVSTVDKKLLNMHSKQLKLKTNEYLATRKQPKPLEDIVKYFEVISKGHFCVMKSGLCTKSIFYFSVLRLCAVKKFNTHKSDLARCLFAFDSASNGMCRLIQMKSTRSYVDNHIIITFYSSRRASRTALRSHHVYWPSSKFSPKC